MLTFVLVACGNGADAEGAPSASGSSSTPTVAPNSPTPAIAKYQDLGVDLQPPAKIDPKAEPALERLQRFHQLFASMIAGAATPPEFSRLANAVTVKRVNDLLKAQRQVKERGAGQLTIRTTKVHVGAALVAVDGCFDQTKLVSIRPDGSRYVDPTVKQNPTMAVRAVLSNTAGPWRVDEYYLTDAKC